MINFLKTWVNQIIVAVIIATIIEMILPNGNNKKYIKIVIGLYVLFTVIQPIVTKFTGNTLNVLDFNYEKYFNKDILETSAEKFEQNNSKLIKQAYIDNIKGDIETKIKQKGYKIISCNINIVEDENLDTYGKIEDISLKIKGIELENESKKENANIIEIQEVNIDINNSDNTSNNIEEKTNISEKDKIEIIEYLASEYSINKENIIIN